MAIRPPAIDASVDPSIASSSTPATTVASLQATVGTDGSLVSVTNVAVTANTAVNNTNITVVDNTTTIDTGENTVVITTDRDVYVTVNEDNFDQNFITNEVNNVGGSDGQIQINQNGNFAGDSTLTFDSASKVLSASGVSTDNLLYANGNPWVFSGTTPGGVNGELQFKDGNAFQGVPGVTWDGSELSLGAVGNVKITGGSSGQTLTTDGAGNLSWSTPASGYSNANVASYLPTYTGNISANYVTATYDVNANVVDANYLYGDGSNITNVAYAAAANTANTASIASSVAGANVVGAVANASYAANSGVAFSVAGANVSGTVANANYAAFANIAEFANNVAVEAVNNNYSYHVVLTTGPGDSTLHNDADDNLQYNPADGILTVTRVDATYFVGDLAFAHGLPAANVTGLGNIATTNFNGNGQTWLSGNGTFANIAIPTVGNIAALNLDGSSSNVLYGNGVFAPVTGGGGGGNLGNLTVTGTTIGIANGASETAIVIGANNSSLTLDTDSGVPVVNLQVQSTDSQYYEESFDYTSGTWVVNGLEGTLTITGYSPAFETFLNSLGRYQSFTITVNGSETTATNGYSYGGGNATFYTLLPPGVDPTNVSNIVFNTVFSNKLLMDPDEGDMGIYIGDFNFDIESQRDVRILAGDDFSIRANDSFQMRANSNFNIIANYANAQQNWSFLTTGNLDIPGNINFAGDPSAAPKLSNFFGVTSAVNFEITTNTASANVSWLFDTTGNLVLPNGNSVIFSTSNSSLDPINPNVSTMTLTPDANYSSQVLVLDPTAPGHIHLRAHAFSNIDEPAANIFLGGENTAFEVTQGANNQARIHSGGNTWTFNNDGTLQVAGGVFANTGASPAPTINGFSSLQVYDSINIGGVTITSADGTNGQVLTTYGNGVTYWSTVSGGGNGSPAGSNNQIQFNSNGAFGASGNYTFTDTVGGGTVTVGNELVLLGNGTISTANSNLNIQPAGNLVVTASAYNWTFDTAGNLTLPGNISGNTNGYALGYLNIPQVSASNATLALTDAGKHYYSTTAGNLTLTIPLNSSVAFPTGTAISIVVQAAGNILVNAAAGVTLYMAGNSTAANRVVGTYGMATLMKVASDTWFINGTGVS